MNTGETKRCAWADGAHPLMTRYHDEEWGTPEHDDTRLFEMLTLEGAQAGLSWRTILNKREGYRRAFDGFDPTRVAAYGYADMARLLADAGIVRNRAKVLAAINNAQRTLDAQSTHGSLDAYLWSCAPTAWHQKAPVGIGDMPVTTPESDAMAQELKRDGWKFVGSKVCYAFMQATGMVDGHVVGCFRAGRLLDPPPPLPQGEEVGLP